MAPSNSPLTDDLPPGRSVTPKLWVSDSPVPEVTTRWVVAQMTHATTGWWPLLLPSDVDLGHFGPERNESVDADQFLASRWESEEIRFFSDPEEVEDSSALLPYAEWPGPAPAGPGVGPGPDPTAASMVTSRTIPAGYLSDPFGHLEVGPDTRIPSPLVDADGLARLGLVETPDSAGAIAASGWEHELGGGPEGTAVLRSWQERYGIRLVALGTDWLAVTVAWPVPVGEIDLARRLAAEHVAFCPDILGEVSFEEYAQGLVASLVWRFWWD